MLVEVEDKGVEVKEVEDKGVQFELGGRPRGEGVGARELN